ADPCAVIGGKEWLTPADVRACFSSFKVDPAIKSNVRKRFSTPIHMIIKYSQILDVVSKTLAFHTSVNYQLYHNIFRENESYNGVILSEITLMWKRVNQFMFPNSTFLQRRPKRRIFFSIWRMH
ncbi:hypothetical protein B0H13DRAFT_1587297, partial [Mycena leptocephala]